MSAGGSFWDRASKMASDAAEATKRAAAATAAAAQKTYDDMKAAPSVVLCPTCNVDLPVPATVWTWTCTGEGKHANNWDASECAQCKIARPKEVPNPSIICPTCAAVIAVPSSNFTKYAKESGHKTATFVKTTAAQTKAYIEHQAAPPQTFHCAHCDALLAVPTGPWACQTCTATNAEDKPVCEKCSQKKTEQKAICGVCGQSTKIPTSNFLNSVQHDLRNLSLATKRIYYDVSGKPYCTCPQCKTHIKAENTPNKNPSEVGPGESAAPAQGDPNPSDPVVPEGAGSNKTTIECPTCKHKFDRQ